MMTNTELHNLRYKLLNKFYDLVYILSTQKPNFIKSFFIHIVLRVLSFRIRLVDNKIKVK